MEWKTAEKLTRNGALQKALQNDDKRTMKEKKGWVGEGYWIHQELKRKALNKVVFLQCEKKNAVFA